jgi:triacylglycerol lipase
MLARIQQFTTLVLLAAASAWGAYFLHAGRPVWAGGGVLLILLGYALFLGIEFVMLAFVNATDAAPRARVSQLLRAWWGEVVTAPRVFCWRQPFRSEAEPDFLPAHGQGRRGVVLVHGFVCNRGLWNPWMAALRAARVPFIAVNLEPVFGSIGDYTLTVDAAVRRMNLATGQAPVIVAHSMGGLAVRAWWVSQSLDSSVHRIVTIGTPHRGTWLARFAVTQNGKQMQLGNAWLHQLAALETPQRSARFTCFYGDCDNIVFPATTATLSGADNRHVPGTAHVHMVFQSEVFNEVWRWLVPDSGDASSSVEASSVAMLAR